jgi:enolase
MTFISDIRAEEVADSRGNPTIAVTVVAGGLAGTFSVPSGASTGSAEVCVLRDEDGHMSRALSNIEDIILPALTGADAADQQALDDTLRDLDGTDDKSKLGGNVLIGVSIAAAKAAAHAKGVELFEHLGAIAGMQSPRSVPLLYMNYINGGKHAQTPLSFQEHMIVPQTDSVHEALDIAGRFETSLAARIAEVYGEESAGSMGDEGGFVIQETDVRAPFRLLMDAAESAGVSENVRIAIDAIALHTLYVSLAQEFPLISIEDPFNEDASADFSSLQSALDIRIVGDDLTVTSANRILSAVEAGAIRAVIVKPNQIGTLTETLDAVRTAKENGVDVIVSHRSGETPDDFIADLAYAIGAFGLKAGALRRPERLAKYERLRAITERI